VKINFNNSLRGNLSQAFFLTHCRDVTYDADIWLLNSLNRGKAMGRMNWSDSKPVFGFKKLEAGFFIIKEGI